MRKHSLAKGVSPSLLRLAVLAALVLSVSLAGPGCSSDDDDGGGSSGGGGGGGSSAVLSSVNGATAPRAALGSGIVIRGSGFGVFQSNTSFVRMTYVLDGVQIEEEPAAAQWTDTAIRVVVPSVRPGGGTFTTPGSLTLQVLGAGVQSGEFTLPLDAQPTFTFAQVSWTPTTSLPAGRRGHGAASVSKDADEAYVYVIGGNDGTENLASVISNTVAPTGEVGAPTSWTAQPSLPEARALHDVAVADSSNAPVAATSAVLYCVGGQPTATAALAGSTTVYFSTVDRATGALSAWATTTALPESVLGARAVVGGGLLFVTGGTLATGAPSNKVHAARIRSDGTLDAFVSSSGTSNLTTAVSFHSAVAAGGILYVLGGDSGTIADPYANAALSPVAQTLGSALFGGADSVWISGTQANRARSRHTTLAAFNQVATIGGLFSVNVADGEMERANVAPGSQGQLTAWTDQITGAPSQFTFNAAGVTLPIVTASGNPQFLLIGGDSTGAPGVSSVIRRTALP